MPRPGGASQSGSASAKARLRTYIQNWLKLREKIENLLDKARSGPTPNPQQIQAIDRLRDQREDLVDDIQDLVGNNPNLSNFAVKLGFRSDLLPASGGRRPGAGDRPGGGGGGGPGRGPAGNRPGGNRPNRDNNRNNNRPEVEGDLLPGEQGKHYQLVRFNGKTYAVYTVKVGKRSVRLAWRIEGKDMDKHGFKEGAGRAITKAQFQNLQVFGVTDEIIRRKGGNKHPFKKWVEEIEATYGGTSILRNKKTLGILMAGFLEQEDPTITEAKIRKTPWYQKRTSYERDWEMVKTKEERKQILGRTEQDIRMALDEAYGTTVDWSKHVKDKEISFWARKIASGQWDEPGAAFNSLLQRLTKRAAKIDGTAAWQAKQEERIAAREFANRPEEMFEQLRADAREWLGPTAAFDRSTLKKWSEDLVFGRKSEADWMDFVRRTKQGLFPYIDRDTPWQEFASPYKGLYEELMGRPTEWNNQMLRDLSLQKEDGTPTGTAMTFSDFTNRIRGSDGFWQSSPVAQEERLGLQNFLAEMFAGVPGGSFPSTLG